jgi:hypothetical protein
MFKWSRQFCWLVLKKPVMRWQNTIHKNLFSRSRFITWGERETWWRKSMHFCNFHYEYSKSESSRIGYLYHFISPSKFKDDLSCYVQGHIWVVLAWCPLHCYSPAILTDTARQFHLAHRRKDNRQTGVCVCVTNAWGIIIPTHRHGTAVWTEHLSTSQERC